MSKLKFIETPTSQYFEDELGRLQGKHIEWYEFEDGYKCMKSLSFYKDDEMHGPFKRWFENGKPQRFCTYVEDRLDGEYQRWHRNNKRKRHCFYKNTVLHGEYQRWDEDGEVEINRLYVDGKRLSCPIPTSEEDKFEICLKYGHMDFI